MQASARATVEAMIQSYCDGFNAKNAAGCAAIYRPDGVIHSSYGPPLVGREAIREAHVGMVAEERNKRMTLLEIDAAGDLGWFVLRYEAEHDDESGMEKTHRGTNLSVIERETDGGWSIRVSSLSGDPE